MSQDRRAPEEPDFRARLRQAGVSSPTLPAAFDLPAPEVYVPEADEVAAATAASPNTIPASVHPVLAELAGRRAQGDWVGALQGFERVAQQIERLPETGLADETLWIEAVGSAFAAARQADETTYAAQQLRRRLPRLQRPPWTSIREGASRSYILMMQLALRMGNGPQALEIFERTRRQIVLTDDLRRQLVDIAVQLGHTDLDVAWLCLEELRSENRRSTVELQRLRDLLRRALRVTLTTPPVDRLGRYVALLEAFHAQDDSYWAVGYLAVAAQRMGRPDEALRWCRLIQQSDQLDAEIRTGIGAVLYLAGRWNDALVQFEKRLPEDAADARAREIGRRLCRLNLLLSAPPQDGDRAARERELSQQVDALLPLRTGGVADLDAAWVLAAGCAVLGRDDDALSLYAAAAPDAVRWLCVQAAPALFEALGRGGDLDLWIDRLASAAVVVAHLLRALAALVRLQPGEADLFLQAAETSGSETLGTTPELELAWLTLRDEWSLMSLATPPLEDGDARAAPAGLAAWRERVAARRRLDRGEFDLAPRLDDSPVQWLARDEETQRIAAVQRALLDPDDEQAGRLFEELAERPGASRLDRLHWGLWLAGHGATEAALAALDSLAGELPDCLECRLGRAACLTHEPARALEILADCAHQAVWQNSPRLTVYRPWARLVPPERWSRGGAVSAHRAADLLYAADLALRCAATPLARTILEQLETLVGERAAEFAPAIGERLAAAALAELQAGQLDLACELHQAAADRGVRDPAFAEQLAAAVSHEEFATDPILQVLFEFLRRPEVDGLEESTVAAVFARFTFIDADTPEGLAEYQRRRDWTLRWTGAQPTWDVPRRNLARAHSREGAHQDVLDVTDQLAALQPDDQRLRGHAFWHLGRFAEAEAAFEAAQEIGWLGCARAAARLQQLWSNPQPLAEDDAERLLSDLNPDACEPLLAPRVRLWRASVLVAARAGGRALDELEAVGDVDAAWSVVVRLLRGAALLWERRFAEAAALWTSAEADLDAWTGPLWALVRLQEPQRAVLGELAPWLRRLRQRGYDSPAFHLVEAEFALRRGQWEEVGAARAAAESAVAPPAEAWLAPLQLVIAPELEFVRARELMHARRWNEAAAAWEQLASRRVWSTAAQYWRAVCSLGGGDVAAGCEQLAALVESADSPEVRGQLAVAHLARGAHDLAQQQATRALELDPQQPFALWARARLAEIAGKQKQARQWYAELMNMDALAVEARWRARAGAAAGRLAESAGDAAAAAQAYRAALEMSPTDAVTLRRLGVLLAFHPKLSQQPQEAEDILARATTQLSGDVAVALAHVAVAERSGDAELVAQRLERLVGLSAFRELPTKLRRQLALRSAGLQLQLLRYGAAATALEQLLADEDSPTVRSQLHQCRMLQALQLLRQTPLPDGALEQLRQATEALCQAPQPAPVAVLLRDLARTLSGQSAAPAAETQAAYAAAQADPQLQPLAALVRYTLGQSAARSQGGAALPADSPIWPQLDVLASNLRQDLETLKREAERVAAAGPSARSPLSGEDLVILSALSDAGKNPDAACALLAAWHRHGQRTERSRVLYSQLMAKRAAKSLKLRKLRETRRLLADAVAVLTQSS